MYTTLHTLTFAAFVSTLPLLVKPAPDEIMQNRIKGIIYFDLYIIKKM
jgi:hypothetical protein